MRRTIGFVMLAGAALWASALLACGDDAGTRPPRAGSQPLPSSQPMRPRPSSEGGGAPMFRGPARGSDVESLARGGGFGKMVRDDRERYEREHRGPERIGPGGDGLVLAQQIAQGLPSAEGPCEEAWQARVAAHEAGQGPRAGTERERREFLAACHDMPAAQQSCMSPLYMQQHAEECGSANGDFATRLQRETGMDLEHGRVPEGATSSTTPMGRGRTPSGRGPSAPSPGPTAPPGDGTPPPPVSPGPTAPAPTAAP